jgi:hypothetical protein
MAPTGLDPSSAMLGGEAFLERVFNAYRSATAEPGTNVWNTTLLIGWDEPERALSGPHACQALVCGAEVADGHGCALLAGVAEDRAEGVLRRDQTHPGGSSAE